MILPVFLPHAGCGHRCSYCNQNHIAARNGNEDIGEQIDSLFARFKGKADVALYGGNPLGLGAVGLERLFSLFRRYEERIRSFRLSARPCVPDDDVLHLLKRHNVTTIELGVPTFNDRLLSLLDRRHTGEDARTAYRALREKGFEVGLQVMVGLPGENIADVRRTAEEVLALAPAFIRIYPLVVIEGTALFGDFAEGRFFPDTLEQAVRKSLFIYVTAWKHGIRTIKMGLTENDVLKEKIVAGPYHPAFGYLVKSEAFRLALEETCHRAGLSGSLLVRLHRNDVPHLVGFQRNNIAALRERSIDVNWATDGAITPGHFEVDGKAAPLSGNLAASLSFFDR